MSLAGVLHCMSSSRSAISLGGHRQSTATILSYSMLLRYLDMSEDADLINQAVCNVWMGLRTADIMEKGKCVFPLKPWARQLLRNWTSSQRK